MRSARWSVLGVGGLAAFLALGCGGGPSGSDADEASDGDADADAAADGDTDADLDVDGEAEGDAGPTCGDRTCEPPETPESCPADCPAARAAPLIDDQDFVVPSDAEAGETVGHAKPYPTVTLVDPAFSIVEGDPAGRFALDRATGLISVTGAAPLEPTTYEVTVELRAQAVDRAVMRIRVIDALAVTFIDPGASAEGADGSRARPLVDWPARLAEGRAYLQRRGTSWETGGGIEYAVGSLMGAWGAGDRPRIRCTGGGHCVSGWRRGGATFRDLEIEAPGGASLLYFNNGGSAPNVVDNCVLHGGEWGLRMTGDGPRNAGHRVVYTEVYDIGDDGFFLQSADDLELGYLFVHHVNRDWVPPSTSEDDASGDGVQLHRVRGFHLHHSRIDRTDSGNKFCVIANESSDGLIEHNDLSGPLATPEGGSTLYLGSDSSSITVRYNTFHPGEATAPVLAAVYMHAPGTRFHGNVFRDLPGGIGCRIASSAEPCEVFHNVFSGVGRHVMAGRVVARNNVFDLRPGDLAFDGVEELVQDHNLFPPGAGMAGSLEGDPLFVDPAAGDFRLRAGSPAIDAGAAVGLSHDRDGTPIPQGEAPDIGAYEHLP